MRVRLWVLMFCSLQIVLVACQEDTSGLATDHSAVAQNGPQMVSQADIDRASRAFDVIVAEVESVEYSDCPNMSEGVPCTTSELNVRRSLRNVRYDGETYLLTAGGIVNPESGIAMHPAGAPRPMEGDRAVLFFSETRIPGEDREIYVLEGGGSSYVLEGADGIRGTNLTADEYLDQLARITP